jgi:hypothetical protein
MHQLGRGLSVEGGEEGVRGPLVPARPSWKRLIVNPSGARRPDAGTAYLRTRQDPGSDCGSVHVCFLALNASETAPPPLYI